MSKFSIYKDREGGLKLPWFLRYPREFDPLSTGQGFATFDEAIGGFIAASYRQCITCGRGAVIDTEFGWYCQTCGSYDVAVECDDPTPARLGELEQQRHCANTRAAHDDHR